MYLRILFVEILSHSCVYKDKVLVEMNQPCVDYREMDEQQQQGQNKET